MRAIVCLATILAFAGCFGAEERPSVDLLELRAEALLTSTVYPDLTIEIDYAPAREPSEFALSALMATLEQVVEKRNLILLPPSELPVEERFTGNTNWSLHWETNPRTGLHREFFDAGPPSNFLIGANESAYLHIFYLNGYVLAPDGTTIYGIATETAIYLFVDVIRDGNPSAAEPRPRTPNIGAERVERTVLIHEVGHALGLVNSGAVMVRPHDDGTGHSTNLKSVMRAGVDGPYAFLDAAFEAPGDESPYLGAPYEFDEYDLEDLEATKARARARS